MPLLVEQIGFPHFLPSSRLSVLVDEETITPVEITSGKTISTNYFDNLQYWRQLASLSKNQGYVVYDGEQSMQTGGGAPISWQKQERIPG